MEKIDRDIILGRVPDPLGITDSNIDDYLWVRKLGSLDPFGHKKIEAKNDLIAKVVSTFSGLDSMIYDAAVKIIEINPESGNFIIDGNKTWIITPPKKTKKLKSRQPLSIRYFENGQHVATFYPNLNGYNDQDRGNVNHQIEFCRSDLNKTMNYEILAAAHIDKRIDEGLCMQKGIHRSKRSNPAFEVLDYLKKTADIFAAYSVSKDTVNQQKYQQPKEDIQLRAATR